MKLRDGTRVLIRKESLERKQRNLQQKRLLSNPKPLSATLLKATEELEFERVKSEEKTEAQVLKIANAASLILYHATTVFPFTFFPTEVVIDAEQINFVQRTFFWTERVRSVYIKDITDVYIDTNIFFATLRLVHTGLVENRVSIHFLWKDDAAKMRKIIQGLNIAYREGVDISKIDVNKWVAKLRDIGDSHIPF